MKLIYTETGKEVKVGDRVQIRGGDVVEITFFREPHKPSSQGKVSVKHATTKNHRGWEQEFYVSVVGAEWIDREDRL